MEYVVYKTSNGTYCFYDPLIHKWITVIDYFESHVRPNIPDLPSVASNTTDYQSSFDGPTLIIT